MAKKRILFTTINLSVGGVEKSLLGLLNALPADKYDIDWGVINTEGDFISQVPEHINLVQIETLHNNYKKVTGRFGAITDALRQGKLKEAFEIPLFYIISKFQKTLIPLYRHFINSKNDNTPQYDIAIEYQGPNELLDYYISDVVKAKCKYIWIHFDVSKFFIRPESVKRCYPSFDRIFIVSQQAKDIFDNRFRYLASKTEVFHNIIDYQTNFTLAQNPIDNIDNTPGLIKILTVGRLNILKAQDIAIRAARILKDKGIHFKWYLVGDGAQSDEYHKLASELNVNDVVVFTGSQPNPYPYMRACDIYVQPSRTEGFCIAIGEAKPFGMPIVATDFKGAREQLDNVPNAIVTKTHEPEEIADAILKAHSLGKLSNVELQSQPQVERLIEFFGD